MMKTTQETMEEEVGQKDDEMDTKAEAETMEDQDEATEETQEETGQMGNPTDTQVDMVERQMEEMTGEEALTKIHEEMEGHVVVSIAKKIENFKNKKEN